MGKKLSHNRQREGAGDFYSALESKNLSKIKTALQDPNLPLHKPKYYKSYTTGLYETIVTFQDDEKTCIKVVRLLLAHPNCTSNDGTGGAGSGYYGFTSSLYQAVMIQSPELVELLLLNGANPNIGHSASEYKWKEYKVSPLYMAITKLQHKIVGILLQFGADPTLGINDRNHTTHTKENCIEAAERIKDKNIVLLCKNMVYGWSPTAHRFYSRRFRKNAKEIVLIMKNTGKYSHIPVELIFVIFTLVAKIEESKTKSGRENYNVYTPRV